MLALLVSCLFLIIISLSVFGGGQVFMPIFKWLWISLSSWFDLNISEITINNIFAIGNATPGILSPKFALITGYLTANGEWWGFVAMLLTYSIFIFPAFLMMYLALRYTRKINNSNFFTKLIKIMNPVIVGIIVALIIQLFLAIIFPFLKFNKSLSEYWTINQNTLKNLFYSDWRKIVLYIYVPTGIIISSILYFKKIPIVYLIIGNIVLSLLLFQPWL
ncbi:chromate transporter [Mycoplasmopsis lipofaciens]|uniref:chromate transporter n=1 Tax=Mycoplasmopsis lipofaciens TaxID=114884 RepID=UPI000561BB35|nr:chromate transporter [Mycoplasmopsis lipofaciens]